MGATCTSSKAVDTTNSIKTKQELSKQAKEHLRNIKQDNQNLDESLLSSSFKTGKKDVGDKIQDQDCQKFQAYGERKHEALWQAMEANDTAAAEKFLNLNEVEELNMYDATGQTMVHKAAAMGYTEMLMLLLERTGAKPDLVNAQLATPLHLACRGNRENIVKFLIGCGVDANASDEHGQTPLLIASIHGHAQLASFLVESSISGHLPEPLEIDVTDHRGLTALNCASIKGELALVQILVQRGGANTNQTSPKGCTPLMYAGRGGFSEVVRFLLEKKASPLKQDSSGGTVFHHAVEKGHLNVMEVMLEHGVDVYSAIEIADNAGRTPLFEAVESTFDIEDEEVAMLRQSEIIRILTRKKAQNGFGAKINVVNYGGQTPLYSAARQGNLEAVKVLIELGAEVDLTAGELVKVAEQNLDDETSFDSAHERCFMDAFMNTMTPLHVATVLGFDEIALYLIEKGADVDFRSNLKGYTPLHMAVLANKPEMLIELLTKANANPMIEDASGRKLLDMVYQYIPSYLDSFQLLLEHLYETQQNEMGGQQDLATVARHFVNPEDDRKIEGNQQFQGIQSQDDQYIQMFEKQLQDFDADKDNCGLKEDSQPIQTFNEVEEEEIEIENGEQMNPIIESVFGRKAALCLISVNWKHKEQALKTIQKQAQRELQKTDKSDPEDDITFFLTALLAAIGMSCREKVIKVFNVSLQILNTAVSSQRIEQDSSLSSHLQDLITEHNIIPKLLLKSEESNTRVTNKIHESLLDLSYQPRIGEDLVATCLLKQINQHYDNKPLNHKGLLAQLALLFKFVASFGLFIPDQSSNTSVVMTVQAVLAAAVPAIGQTNVDVKNAAIKIVLDVQKLSGDVKESDFSYLNDKTREALMEKIFSVQLEKEANQKKKDMSLAMFTSNQPEIKIVNIGLEKDEEGSKFQKRELFEKNKALVIQNSNQKDWMMQEVALNAMLECFENASQLEIASYEGFVTECTILLKDSLETNNMTVYMVAIQVASVFLEKTLHLETVKEALQSYIKAIVLHTTDTNTRVRKKSIDLINQLWSFEVNKSSTGINGGKGSEELSTSALIASVLMDSTLNEKAIVGRLGLFIKKTLLIESSEDLNKKAHQLIIGKDYEQLTEFACSWCMHKNTKVRQCALKLIVEICRLNYIDPRGAPFKQRIINFILALRHSLRDPLVAKINEVCGLENTVNQSNMEAPKKKVKNEPFINLNQQELGIATSQRSASLDVRRGIKQSAQNIRQFPQIQSTLPSITRNILPGISQNPNQHIPTLVLPHSEPLTEAQLKQAEPFLDIFGIEIMTCFLSHNWATRQTAMQKVEEQLHNFDPRRRDAMYGEINRNNQPPEVSFKIFLMFAEEGIKDPNLKNYLMILELIQKSLPIYFRYLVPLQIKRELMPVSSLILKKCSDMKAKVREASINFCLFLSHQSPIGPQCMVELALAELQMVDKKGDKPSVMQEIKETNVHLTFANNNLVASCLHLLGQFQQQSNIIAQPSSQFFDEFLLYVNKALRNQNPTVRKEGESLFKILYSEFGEAVSSKLVDQKPQLVQKLFNEAKQESAQLKDETAFKLDKFSTAVCNKELSAEEKDKQKLTYVQSQLKDELLNAQQIKELLQGHEDLLTQLKLPNAKKRVKAIVQIKKIIQSKLTQLNMQKARDLLEPLTMLSGMLLKDDDPEVYLESLQFLKFVVGGLAPHISSLDLFLMMGGFTNAIVNNKVDENIRIHLASNKVIIFFAKHQNIGSLVVAKEVLKLIERSNKSMLQMNQSDEEELKQKADVVIRLYGILQMLIQQFSIVLCYQPNFLQQALEQIADTLLQKIDNPTLKASPTSIVISLFQIDQKVLDLGISKLDLNRKTPLKKIIIEYENNSKKGGQAVRVNLNAAEERVGTSQIAKTPRQQRFVAGQSDRDKSPEQSMRDTLQSFKSISKMSEQDLGNSTFYSQTQKQKWDERVQTNSEVRLSARSDIFMVQQPQSDSMRNTLTLADRLRKSNDRKQEPMLPDITRRNTMQTVATEKTKKVGAGFRRDSEAENFTGKDNNKYFNLGQPIPGNLPNKSTIEAMSARSSQNRLPMQSQSGEEAQQDLTRPPLYVPSRRTNPSDKPPQQQQQQSSSDFKSSLYKQVQPTMTSQPSRGISREQASQRYQPTQAQLPTTFISKLKAPAAATFQSKVAEYDQPKREEPRNLF